MAVVTKYGTGFPNPTLRTSVDADLAEYHSKGFTSRVTIANGDSIASLLYLGRVPSNAAIDPRSILQCGAVTGVTVFTIGIQNPNGGAVIDDDLIVAAATLATAGNFTLYTAGAGVAAAVAIANIGKPLWQVAALPADPGGVFDVVGKLGAAATATADLVVFLDFLRKM